jgi:hypothetical protein
VNSEAILTVGIGLGLIFLSLTALYTAAIKILAPQLTVLQCLITSAASTVAGSLLIVAHYLFLKPVLQERVQAVAYVLIYLIYGWLITRLVRRYGVEKEGWLGVGGRANLWLLCLWALVGVLLATQLTRY